MKRERIDKSVREKIEQEARRVYGIRSFFNDYELFMSGEGKIRATTRETAELAEYLKKVDSVGVYVAKYRRWGLTFSIEGSQILDGVIERNVIELTREEAKRWMTGAPVELKPEHKIEGKFVVAKYRRFYLGSGVMGRDGKVYPLIPKWRRIPSE
ncbi:MAG TPA: hypothetical protein EYH45_04935 [Candidatus Caldiarchaeum subterraneum]|uniref:rRNA small subunit methyltransferase F RNA-binding PUA-like domain-containing protein n=1 Tax=Caldiarchaeum subterraneum TaxID=311458 RepID=A0A832ZW20_CALS0|nr:hypothetical protein [Candidatus Caldarchaeum subterraneum]